MAARKVGTTMTGGRPAGTPAAEETWSLHVVFPAELRRSFALPAPRDRVELTVGRDPGPGGILLDEGTVSRRHAVLAFHAAHGLYTIRDLESRNGTHADGVNVKGEARPIANGSVLRVGDVLAICERDEVLPEAAGDDDPALVEAFPGTAAATRALRDRVARLARDPVSVLVLGETGTGKERIARELHRLSSRSGKLVALNCATLSETIVESQLFGHAKGAFTGASEAQPGLFRAAHGGTLFLDEIGELPLSLQPKLLRTLQEGEILPVGATQPLKVDVRVVAATHRDLARAAREGRFREDLYARLSIAELRVPALRDRRGDLLAWIERLHAAWAARRGEAPALRFDADAAEVLLRAHWPLNLRGLERLVQELGTRARPGQGIAKVVGAASLPAWVSGPARSIPAEETGLTREPDGAAQPQASSPVPTREEFKRAFEELGGSVHALARRFGRDRRQIYRWVEAHGLGEGRDKRR